MVSHMDQVQCFTQMVIFIVVNGLMEENREEDCRFTNKLIVNIRVSGDKINRTETGN
jgi:hypothetical protein